MDMLHHFPFQGITLNSITKSPSAGAQRQTDTRRCMRCKFRFIELFGNLSSYLVGATCGRPKEYHKNCVTPLHTNPSNSIPPRRSHGFIIKLTGETAYHTQDGVFHIRAGEVLYVACGSSYAIQQIHPGFSCVVNFNLPVPPEYGVKKFLLPRTIDADKFSKKLYLHR